MSEAIFFSRTKKGRTQFWIQDPQGLISDWKFIPNRHMSLEEKMNAITRLVIIIFIIMLILKYKHALPFLIVTLVLIVFLYYAQRRRIDRMKGSILKSLIKADIRNGVSFDAHPLNLLYKKYGRLFSAECDDPEELQLEFERLKENSFSHSYSDAELNYSDVEPKHDYVPLGSFDRFRVKNGRGGSDHTPDQQTGQPDDQDYYAQAGNEEVEEQNDEDDNDQDDQDDYPVQGMKSKSAAKRNPRRPYPATVPASLEVKSSNYGKVFNTDPRYQKFSQRFQGHPEEQLPDVQPTPAVNPDNVEVDPVDSNPSKKKYGAKQQNQEDVYKQSASGNTKTRGIKYQNDKPTPVHPVQPAINSDEQTLEQARGILQKGIYRQEDKYLGLTPEELNIIQQAKNIKRNQELLLAQEEAINQQAIKDARLTRQNEQARQQLYQNSQSANSLIGRNKGTISNDVNSTDRRSINGLQEQPRQQFQQNAQGPDVLIKRSQRPVAKDQLEVDRKSNLMKSFQGGPKVNYKNYAQRIPVTKAQGYKTKNFNDVETNFRNAGESRNPEQKYIAQKDIAQRGARRVVETPQETSIFQRSRVQQSLQEVEEVEEVLADESEEHSNEEEIVESEEEPAVLVETAKPRKFYPSNYNPVVGNDILLDNHVRTKSGGKLKVEAKNEDQKSNIKVSSGRARYLPGRSKVNFASRTNQDPSRPKSSDFMFQQAARLSKILQVKERDRTDRQSQINSMF